MLTQAQIAEFRERGFLQAGRIMSDEQADRLRARLMEVMEGRGQAQPERIGGWGEELKVIQIFNIWAADDLF